MIHVDRYVVDSLTALVHRGEDAPKAGLQFQVNGRTHKGFIIEPAHKKRPIRLAVGSPGRSATVWRIWAHHNASDVYIGPSHTANIHKISLHTSGDWRYQANGSIEKLRASSQVGYTAADEESDERILGSWQRPELPQNGWIDAMRLVVPTSEVVPHPNTHEEASKTGQIQWIAPAPAGFALEVRFFIVQPGKGPFGLNPAVVQEGGISYWGGMTLPSSEVLIVVSSTFPIEPSQHAELQQQKHKAQGTNVRGNYDSSYQHAPRMLVPEFEKNYATFWDLSGY